MNAQDYCWSLKARLSKHEIQHIGGGETIVDFAFHSLFKLFYYSGIMFLYRAL
jgi:hypothetical protein